MKIQTYNDGEVKIYKTDDISEKGKMPKEALVLKEKFRYNERIVGMTRFFIAKQYNNKISRLIRIQRKEDILEDDIAIPNDGKQYRIVQIQYPEDTEPKSMDLSLERLITDYDIAGI